MKKMIFFLVLSIVLLTFVKADTYLGAYAYYNFNETNGNAIDSTGNGRTATVNSVTQGILGKIGTAYNNFGRVNTPFTFTSSPISVSVWVYPTSFNSGYIIQSDNGGWDFDVYLNSSGSIVYNNGANNINSGVNIQLNTWSNIIVSVDGTNSTIFLNGQLSYTGAGGNSGAGTNYCIGNHCASNIPFGGSIDEVGFWNRKLNNSDINSLYNNGLGYGGGNVNPLQVNLISPQTNSYVTLTIGTNFTANYSVSVGNMNLTNATYYLWYNNGTIFNTTTVNVSGNSTNSTTLFMDAFSYGTVYLWNVFSCIKNSTSSICAFASSNYTFTNLPISENAISFNNISYETNDEIYILNFSFDTNYFNSANAILIYNNTNYSTMKSSFGKNQIFTSILDIPLINSNQVNNTFYWLISLTNTNGGITYYNTSFRNQTVNNLILSNCNLTYNVKALNLSIYDEMNQTLLNSSFLSTFRYWVGSGSIFKNYSFQDISGANNTFNLCIYPNITINADIDSSFTSTGYYSNKYYFRNTTLSNISAFIPLYLLSTTSSGTKFSIQIQNGATFPSGVLVQVLKYFIGSGTYKTTSTQITDQDGKFSLYLDLDASYRFILIQNGIPIGSIDKSASCSVAPCSMTLRLSSSSGNAFDGLNAIYASNVLSNISFDNNKKLVTYNFIDTTGLSKYFRLEVDGFSLKNDSYIICSTQTSASAGSLSCDLSNYTGNFIAKGYISRSPEKLDPNSIYAGLIDENTVVNIGLDGLWIVMGIIITLVFATAVISRGSPTAILFIFAISIFGLKVIHLLPFSWILLSTLEVTLIYLIVKLKT